MGIRLGTRVNLTLPVEVVAVLDRMGSITGHGRATIIREWLSDSLPNLNKLADAIELAHRKNIDGFAVMAETLQAMAGEADQLAMDFRAKRRAAQRAPAKPRKRRTPSAGTS